MLGAGLLDQEATTGKLMRTSSPIGGEGFQRHVACTLDCPFIVLFEQQRPAEADDGIVVREDPDNIGAALDFAVQTLDRIRNRYEVSGTSVSAVGSFVAAGYAASIRDRGSGSTKVRAGRCTS